MKKLSKYINGLNLFLLAAIILSGFSILFLGAYYSHPNAEDFSLCATPKNHGLLYAVKALLIGYDGRYFTNILHALNPLAFGCYTCYKWVGVFSIILPVFSIFYFLQSLVKSNKRLNVLLASLIIVLVNLAISPSLAHQIYWMVSSFVYHYSWCLWLVWVGSYIRFLKETDGRRYLMLSVTLMVCSMGMNEMFLIINVFSLVALFGLTRLKYPDKIKSYWPFLASGLICIVFFLSNPGISQRLQIVSDVSIEASGFILIQKSLADFWTEFIIFLSRAGLIAPLIILATLYLPKYVDLNPKVILWVGLGLILAAYTTTLAFYLPMGFEENLPDRIFTTIYFGLLLGFILLLSSLSWTYLNSTISHFPLLKSGLTFFSILILALALVLGENNLLSLQQDYNSGKMRYLNETMQSRYSILEKAQNDSLNCWKVAVIPPLNPAKQTNHHPPDIQPNRTTAYWNQAYEQFFLVNEVRLTGDTLLLIDQLQMQE